MLPFFALALPVLVALCGLVIDVGLMENQSLAMQNAADAASLGAELEQERGSSDFIQIGQAIAALNGFKDGEAQTSVTVAQRPTTGSLAGDFDAIEVHVSRPAHTLLLQYIDSPIVSVRAVSLIPPCTFFRGIAANPGVPTLSVTNSTLSLACPTYSSGNFALDSASTLVATAWNFTGSAGSVFGGASVSPVPRFNAATLRDPLAGLTQPVAGACTKTSFSQSGGSATLYPGTYCRGLNLSNTTVTFTPGLYIVTGGGHWANAQVQGRGVTLFFTQGGGSSFGQFLIDGNSNVTLAAPVDSSAGGIPAMLLFADRQWSPTSTYDFQIRNASVQADGIFYTTNTGLLLSNSTLRPNKYLGLDTAALSLAFSQFAASGNFSSVTTGSPFRPLGGSAE